jgi:CheY-like chemotaxis protein
MNRIVLVSSEYGTLGPLAESLKKYQQNSVSWVSSGEEVFEAARNGQVDVVVAAADLGDGDGHSFIEQVAKKLPLINSALISPLRPDEFHEKTEGLGVFMQLPENPGSQEAKKMMELLDSINVLFSSSS